MADDDEFGDLYVDVLRPASGPAQSFPSSTGGMDRRDISKPGALDPNFLFEEDEVEDEDDEKMLQKGSDSFDAPTSAPSSRGPGSSLALEPRKEGGEEWMLGDARTAKEEPADWSDDGGADLGRVSGPKEEYSPPEGDEFRFSLDEEEEEEEEVDSSTVDVSRVKEEEGKDIMIQGAISTPATGKMAERTAEMDHRVEDADQDPVIPGLSDVSPAPGAFRGMNGNDEKISRSEDSESDSDDDLQIVLNDDSVGRPFGAARSGAAGVEDEDEEEDLVIVTDEDHHHHHLAAEEHEYGEEIMQAPLEGERNEALESSKGNGGIGGIGMRIGYSSHGFHSQHHSQFKYIRPGAAAPPGGSTASTPAALGQARPPLAMGPMGARSRGMQKGYGAPAWGGNLAARPYGGLDFTLPSHKTIFDVDIDGFEEKPWRLPGVDVSDFFNFGLDEDSWKDYRKHLEQLRLEATMQSKIRVYESGRSEQDYDPDLPPELAAATGVQDMYSDGAHHGKADAGGFDVRSHQQLPMGRAIQVEGGCGDRLPSIDTRRPRMRDSDAIIEIIPQDSFDDSIASDEPLNHYGYEHRGKDLGAGHESEELHRVDDTVFFDHSPPVHNDIKREVIEGKENFQSGPEENESQGPIYASGAEASTREEGSDTKHDVQGDESGPSKGDGGAPKSSPSTEEVSADVILDGVGEGDQDEKLALDDGDDLDYEERASDLQDTGEALKDNGSHKSTARVDEGATRGDSRRGKSESSNKDYATKRHHDEERRSSQRRDDHGERHQAGSRGRQDSSQSQSQSQSHHGRPRSEAPEKAKERDDAHGRRGKDEGARRDRGEEAGSRHKDKARVSEKKGKDGDVHPRKQDDADRKGHPRDSAARQKERDDVKKRKDEEQRRRDKDSKEHSQHGYRGRDDGADHRKREDQARDSSSRHRDDNWKQREKEDGQREKPKEREDRSSRAAAEDRVSSGGGRGSEGNSSKDRRRYPDKGADNAEKHKREEMRSLENQSIRMEKNSKQQRSSGDADRHRSGDGKKTEREPQKESSRMKKETEAVERKPASGKRKRGDRGGLHSDKGGSSKGTFAQQEGSKTSQKGRRRGDELPDVQDLQNTLPPPPPPPPLPMPPPVNPAEEKADSDGEGSQRGKRGRSKLERWTSQKDREFDGGALTSSENNGEAAPPEAAGRGGRADKVESGQSSDALGKDKDRHLETVAKLKKRSERFKVPLPGEKEVATAEAEAKKSESEVPLAQSETPADADVKQERPARKRRWSSSA